MSTGARELRIRAELAVARLDHDCVFPARKGEALPAEKSTVVHLLANALPAKPRVAHMMQLFAWLDGLAS